MHTEINNKLYKRKPCSQKPMFEFLFHLHSWDNLHKVQLTIYFGVPFSCKKGHRICSTLQKFYGFNEKYSYEIKIKFKVVLPKETVGSYSATCS